MAHLQVLGTSSVSQNVANSGPTSNNLARHTARHTARYMNEGWYLSSIGSETRCMADLTDHVSDCDSCWDLEFRWSEMGIGW